MELAIASRLLGSNREVIPRHIPTQRFADVVITGEGGMFCAAGNLHHSNGGQGIAAFLEKRTPPYR